MIPKRDTAADGCKLVLVRHQHTDLAGTFCGRLDPPLSAQGRAQLKELTQSLDGYSFRAVYSSHLQRARDTAEALATSRHLPVHLRAGLEEMAFGEWEGLSWKEVVARDSAFAQRWLNQYPAIAAPGGERFDDLASRVRRVMNDIAEEAGHGHAAIVTHAGVIRTILASVTLVHHAPMDLTSCPYGSWWEIWRQDNRWVLQGSSADVQSEVLRAAAAVEA